MDRAIAVRKLFVYIDSQKMFTDEQFGFEIVRRDKIMASYEFIRIT